MVSNVDSSVNVDISPEEAYELVTTVMEAFKKIIKKILDYIECFFTRHAKAKTYMRIAIDTKNSRIRRKNMKKIQILLNS
ncbi:hypothetical protein EP58_06585 [Listeria newyorkensis]|nr:hypothetical protein EP58_06585 [Listeria newyorkensis]